MNRKTFFVVVLFLLLYCTNSFSFKQSYYDYVSGLLDIQSMNYQSAIKKFENVIRSDPQAVDVYIQLIQLYIIEGETAKLKNICKNIETIIVDTQTIIEICNTLSLHGYIDIATEILERLLLSNPNDKDLLFTLAQIYFSTDTKKSLNYYRRYLQLYPEDTTVYLPTAILEYQLGNINEAKQLLQKIYNKSYTDKIFNLLEELLPYTTTDYMSLIEHYEKLLKTEPKNYKILGMLFSTLVIKGQMDKAEKYVKMLMSVPKKEFLPEYYFYIALFYENKGLYTKAIQFMKKFITYSKTEDETPYLKLAYYYFMIKQYNQVVKILTVANKKFNSESVKILLFYAYLDKKDYKNAISTLYELKSISSTFKRIDFYLGYCYDQIKDFEKTEFYMLEAIKNNPDDHEAMNYLGYLYADKNINIDKAEQLILKALSYEPTNYAYIDSLAWVYYRKNMYEKAEQLFEQIKNYDDPIIYEHIGDVKTVLKKYNEAIEFYSKSLKLNPKNKNVLNKLKNVKSKLKTK